MMLLIPLAFIEVAKRGDGSTSSRYTNSVMCYGGSPNNSVLCHEGLLHMILVNESNYEIMEGNELETNERNHLDCSSHTCPP